MGAIYAASRPTLEALEGINGPLPEPPYHGSFATCYGFGPARLSTNGAGLTVVLDPQIHGLIRDKRKVREHLAQSHPWAELLCDQQSC